MTDESLMSADAGSTVNDSVAQESGHAGIVQQDLNNEVQAAAEKMVPQSTVDNLVATARNKGYQKGVESVSVNNQPAQTSVAQPAAAQSDNVDISALVDKRVAEIAQEQQRLQAEAQAKAEIEKDVAKIEEIAGRGKQSIDGFEEAMKGVDGFRNALNLLRTVTDIENAEHVLHYLSQNPATIPSLDALASSIPSAAKAELNKISARLKQNESAKNMPSAPAPLGSISPNNDTRSGMGRTSDKPESEYSVKDWERILAR